jgi:glutaconyl-CoA/methylmalonyl-CoA decarboxylase subunit gamma
MRLTVERDGKKEPVEVAPDLSSVTLGGRTFPVAVVATSATRVELEIAGERVVVENWPEHFAEPPGPVDVSGERWKVALVSPPTPLDAVRGRPGAPATPVPAAPVASPAPGSPAPPAGGVPILPPMPGRVVEVRVKEGDRVGRGDVLLVLEAMKMRNEVVSPAEGVVRGLKVSSGANVRAKEPMLFIVRPP